MSFELPVPPVEVDPDLCVKCPKCMESCRFGAIEIERAKARILPNCTGCGACISACPTDAIAKAPVTYPWFGGTWGETQSRDVTR